MTDTVFRRFIRNVNLRPADDHLLAGRESGCGLIMTEFTSADGVLRSRDHGQSWEIVRDYYYKLGVMKDKLPPEDYYLTDASFYAEANAFDRSQIEAMAHSYKNTCADAK